MKLTDYIDLYKNNIIAISDKGDFVSYNEINILSRKFYSLSSDKCLVFQFSSNVVESLIGYLSFQKVKWVPLMLSENADKSFVYSLINQYNPNYFWIDIDKCDNFDFIGNIVLEYGNYCLIENSKVKHDMNEDLALLLSTSGTTGSAKLVRLSYENIISNAESIASYLALNEGDRPITSLPMYYSYGLSVINSHVLKGATILLTNYSVLQMEFWSFFKKESATSLAGVPYTYEMLKKIRFSKMNLQSLKTLTQAGGKLSSDLVYEFAELSQDKGFEFFVMYGQTEATARMSYLPISDTLFKSSSIGIAIPGGRFELRDLKGNIIEKDGVDGELYYYGKNVFMGYALSLSDLSFPDENKGKLKTGDIAYRDKDGYYYITGRLNRFVKIFGNRVGLDEVEQIVKQYTSDCACIGSDEKITIFITKLLDIDLISLLSQKLHLYSNVFEIKIVSEIPKSESGKVLYSKL